MATITYPFSTQINAKKPRRAFDSDGTTSRSTRASQNLRRNHEPSMRNTSPKVHITSCKATLTVPNSVQDETAPTKSWEDSEWPPMIRLLGSLLETLHIQPSSLNITMREFVMWFAGFPKRLFSLILLPDVVKMIDESMLDASTTTEAPRGLLKGCSVSSLQSEEGQLPSHTW